MCTHLLLDLPLNLLEVTPEVHGHFVFGSQEGGHHGFGRHPHPPQSGLLKPAVQILHHHLQVINLTKNID